MIKDTSPYPKIGFTLIEMLVVIAIIALLSALITPAISRPLQSTKNSVCTSNLHQVGVAIAHIALTTKETSPLQDFTECPLITIETKEIFLTRCVII